MKKIVFSEKEKEKICELFENGANLRKITKIFGCSGTPIGKILIEILGLEKYKKIAKGHRQKNCSINLKKWQEDHPKEFKEIIRKLNIHPNTNAVRPENGRKVGNHPNTNAVRPENGRKYGIPAMQKKLREGVWISKPETNFYNILTSQNSHLTVKRQYYLKGLNHPYDIAIPELNLLIEIDGNRWHGHSENKEMNAERLKRDAEVDKFAKDNGWTVIRINDKILKKLGIIK